MSDNLPQKVHKYEAFVNETLREDLKKVLKQKEAITTQIAEYLQLENTISKLELSECGSTFKTKVDLGCNFYANATVQNNRMIFVKVGFGIFIELTLEEAKTFIQKRLTYLQEIIDSINAEASKIKATIKVVTKSLQELQGIANPEKPRREL
ncbi:hypothetical protein CHUAL_007504 [Chamberlinius hualienensis]